MYINDDIPVNFNKIYEINDNYIVLGTNNILSSGVDYEVYVQYFYPSIYVLHLYDYQIKMSNCSELTLNYNYYNMGITESVSSFTQSTISIDRDDYNDSIAERADYTLIFVCQFLICVWFVWFLNQLTKLVHKGGIFY